MGAGTAAVRLDAVRGRGLWKPARGLPAARRFRARHRQGRHRQRHRRRQGQDGRRFLRGAGRQPRHHDAQLAGSRAGRVSGQRVGRQGRRERFAVHRQHRHLFQGTQGRRQRARQLLRWRPVSCRQARVEEGRDAQSRRRRLLLQQADDGPQLAAGGHQPGRHRAHRRQARRGQGRLDQCRRRGHRSGTHAACRRGVQERRPPGPERRHLRSGREGNKNRQGQQRARRHRHRWQGQGRKERPVHHDSGRPGGDRRPVHLHDRRRSLCYLACRQRGQLRRRNGLRERASRRRDDPRRLHGHHHAQHRYRQRRLVARRRQRHAGQRRRRQCELYLRRRRWRCRPAGAARHRRRECRYRCRRRRVGRITGRGSTTGLRGGGFPLSRRRCRQHHRHADCRQDVGAVAGRAVDRVAGHPHRHRQRCLRGGADRRGRGRTGRRMPRPRQLRCAAGRRQRHATRRERGRCGDRLQQRQPGFRRRHRRHRDAGAVVRRRRPAAVARASRVARRCRRAERRVHDRQQQRVRRASVRLRDRLRRRPREPRHRRRFLRGGRGRYAVRHRRRRFRHDTARGGLASGRRH